MKRKYESPHMKVTPMKLRARMMVGSNSVTKEGYGDLLNLDNSVGRDGYGGLLDLDNSVGRSSYGTYTDLDQ